ncbi:MAG: glycosyltransferase [Candidatus Micrarchaeia archaeon]
MRVLLVGHDFDFSEAGGISRYSNELFNGLRKRVELGTIATGGIPRPLRVLMPIVVRGYDIVEAVYPDVAKIIKGNAKMVTMWHDLRLITKYATSTQAKLHPKLVERYNIANRIIRYWTLSNYANSEAVIANSTKTMNEVVSYVKNVGVYDPKKLYRTIPLGIDDKFIRAKVWYGERQDFVYIGDIHVKNKNFVGLIEAFDSIVGVAGDARLHIFTKSAGAEEFVREYTSKAKHIKDRNITLHLHATDEYIIETLRKAVACIFLSKDEGFGLPVLESLAVGTNVIVLKGNYIPREVIRYAIKASEDEVPRVALKLMQNPREATSAAIKYAKGFTWERNVRMTIELYNEMLKL